MTTISASSGNGTVWMSSVSQSMRRAVPSTAAIDTSWSMIPHGTPTAASSARWQACAASTGLSRSAPSAVATATSRAADDARPLPAGSVEWTMPTSPSRGRTSRTTAAT